MIGDDAQKIFPADGGYSARTDIAPPAGLARPRQPEDFPVDNDFIEKDNARIKKRFNEIFQ